MEDIMGLATLSPDHRRRVLARIVGQGLADAISPALDLPTEQAEAIVRRLVPDAGLTRVDRPRDSLAHDRWFTRSMMQELRAACETRQEYAMLAVGYLCGLRAQEYTILQWQDLGWSPKGRRTGRAEVIRVTRVKKRRRVRDEILTRMVHDVVLDGGTMRALRDWCESREEPDTDSPWVFPGQDGGQACAKTILRRFQRVARRCPSYVRSEYRWARIHSLRHSLAVHMVEGGFEMADIQDRLGHDSPESTRIYAQMSNPRKRMMARDMTSSNAIARF